VAEAGRRRVGDIGGRGAVPAAGGRHRDEEDRVHAVGADLGDVQRTDPVHVRAVVEYGDGHDVRDTPVLRARGVERRSFRSMGTTVRVIAPAGQDRPLDRAADRVLRRFEREDRRFSRFREDSELTRLNRNAGRWTRVSAPFAALVRRALLAARETDGLFDPTVLPALRAAGYDRDFAEVEDRELADIRREVRELMVHNATACGAWPEIELDAGRIRMPVGAELDLGGIAKGWTVDAAARDAAGLPWAIVDAGGDLRLAGRPPAEGLEIGIEDPEEPGAEVLRLRIGDGALATTSIRVRSWGADVHHVIDPRTALPSLTPVVQATVWAPTCTDAEVWSKAALLGGVPVLERVPAVLVLRTGELVTSLDEAPADRAESTA
jgi:FAD:protein FMN transferase